MVELVTLQMRDCIFLSAQEVGLQHLLKTLKQKKCGTYIIRTCVYIYIYIYIECIEIHQSNWKTSASSDFNVLSLQIVAQMLSGRGVDCMGGTKQTGKIWNKISVVYNVSLEKNVFNPIIVDRSNLADPTVTTLI